MEFLVLSQKILEPTVSSSCNWSLSVVTLKIKKRFSSVLIASFLPDYYIHMLHFTKIMRIVSCMLCQLGTFMFVLNKDYGYRPKANILLTIIT